MCRSPLNALNAQVATNFLATPLQFGNAQVTIETDEMRFNTAIAGMMEFMNAVYKWPNRPRAALEPFVLLLVRERLRVCMCVCERDSVRICESVHVCFGTQT
jgi:hypothetical protein